MATQMRGIPLPYLRAWRIQRAMSQGDLAEASGVSRMSISSFETTPTRNASFPTIKKLATALGISSEELAHIDPRQAQFLPPTYVVGKVVAA